MTQAMPYRQQVFPPQRTAPQLSATPSASQDHKDPAGEEEGARGRSSSQGPQDRQRRNQSSTRGSQKRQRGTPSDSLIDQMANYVASGWKRDLTHFISCCWAAQIGFLDRDKWHMAITKFLGVMAKQKANEWTDIKELMPLQFMPYVAKLQRGHRPRPPGPQPVYWMDQRRGLLPLESSPTRPGPSHPPPPKAANA